MLNTLFSAIARKRYLHPSLRFFKKQTATFHVIDEIQIEIPLLDKKGPAFYLNNGGPAAFYHYEEKEKIEILRSLPSNGVFFDIGANIGLFSFYFAKILPKAKCIAFEPDPLLFHCLGESIRKSEFKNVERVNIALSNEKGTLPFYLHKMNFGGSSLISENIANEERSNTINVEANTLDQWLSQNEQSRVDCIKIDVQGNEHKTLLGAVETIRRFTPLLLVEIEFKHLDSLPEWNEILLFLESLGYEVRLAGKATFSTPSQIRGLMGQSEQTDYDNFVFTLKR